MRVSFQYRNRIRILLQPWANLAGNRQVESGFWFAGWSCWRAVVSRMLNQVEWVKPTHQARSQETLERILDAAEEVISERGFDNATVSEIVRRGKSSVGAMYARFHDKDSLLVCLHERFCEQAAATTEMALDATRWEGASIAEIFATTTPFVVHTYHMKRGLIRAFIVRCS